MVEESGVYETQGAMVEVYERQGGYGKVRKGIKVLWRRS